MAIGVEWQKEDGTPLASYDGPALTAEMLQDAPPTSACLRFIDPLGDTTFNQAQVDVLVGELPACALPGSLVDFVRRYRGQAHTYLKFIGD